MKNIVLKIGSEIEFFTCIGMIRLLVMNMMYILLPEGVIWVVVIVVSLLIIVLMLLSFEERFWFWLRLWLRFRFIPIIIIVMRLVFLILMLMLLAIRVKRVSLRVTATHLIILLIVGNFSIHLLPIPCLIILFALIPNKSTLLTLHLQQLYLQSLMLTLQLLQTAQLIYLPYLLLILSYLSLNLF